MGGIRRYISSYAGCEKAKELLLFDSKMNKFILEMNKLDLILICLHLLFLIFNFFRLFFLNNFRYVKGCYHLTS